ncbi:pancreatic lipase-related protein 3-like [Bicyclus anynana]|uniref:Pancreatic lipase-related protein 3-like n=1 Tax=Bicyclus anynana TaxID=110368 RepID=A0ABM3LHB6_BICAN|nr:pancreatic lipase-related protein 3-like [Bicyclus anynana]
MNRLKRITALDPAGLYFENMPSIVRLHKEDAEYIEVLHTNAYRFSQGNKELLGHADFFANGGKKQPGCNDKLIYLESIRRGDLKLGETLPGCSHKRSLKYYLETLINQSCNFLGIACQSYKDFLKGKCSCGVNTESCLRLNTPRPPRSFNNSYRYYFVTSSSRPFCSETLKVLMSVQSPPTEELYVNGYFNITVPQSIGNVNFLINENRKIQALKINKQHSFVVFRSTPPPLILPIKRLLISWHHQPFPCYWFTTPRVTSFMIQKLSDDKNDTPQWFCAMNTSSRDVKYVRSKTSAINGNSYEKGQILVPCKN